MSSHLLTKQTKIMIRLDHKKQQPSTKSCKVILCFKNNQSSTIDRQISLKKSQSILQKMLRQQDELLTASSCRFNQINREVIEQFLERIRDQVQTNDIYNKLLNKQIILDILQQYRKRYINHQKFTQLIDLILDYMAISKNFMNRGNNLLPTSLKIANLPSTIAYRWLRLKSQIYFSNMDYLKILSYLAQDNDLGHSFTTLSFNFTKQQIRKVSKVIKELCSYDIRAFCLLTNYLYICCHKLQRNGENIKNIQNKLNETLKMLDDENLPAPPFQGNHEQANFHKDYKARQQQYLIKCIDLSSILPKYKIMALESYIQRRIADAIEAFYPFNELVKSVCIQYGYHYRSSLKLKDKTERMAMNRVIEKIVSDYLPGKLRKSQIINFVGSIEELAELEYSQYEQNLKQLIASTNTPIQFKVSDLLRSKCMFATVEKLNKCLSQLKQNAQICGWKIVEVKNRLRKRTTDILIKLGKGEVIGEIQLALDFKVAENEFNHKIYQLRRTQMFSPLDMLYQLNKRLTNNFIRQLHSVVKANTRLTSTNDYSQLHTFYEVQKYFSKFVSILPINLDFSKSHRNQIDVNLMGTQIQKLGVIISNQIEQTPIVNKIQKVRRNGQFYYELKKYQQAEKWLNNYCEIFRSQHEILINRLNPINKQFFTTWSCSNKEECIAGIIIIQKHQKLLIKKYVQALNLLSKVYMDMANYDKSTEICFYCREILQKINADCNDQILLELQKNIGWNQFQRGNYITAIESYSNFLTKIEDSKGVKDINYGMTLNYIGIIHQKTGNYDESTNYYTRGLEIIQVSKGKYSSQYASILQNLGLTYLNQGHYGKAIEIFQKCLEISQKGMGKDSINCAQTLNNIGNVYNRMGNSQQAMSYYKKCLSIQQKVKGVQYIDYAKILGNIGLLIFNDYEYEQALKYYRKSLSIKEKILGKKNIELVYTLNNIGLVLTSQGQYQQALKIYERCITIQKLSRNNSTIEYSNTLNNIAMIFKQTGDYFKAADYLQQGLKIVQSIEGSQCMDYAFLMQSLGQIYYEQDNYDYALVHFQIALQIIEAFSGRDSIDYATVLSYCAGVKCRIGLYDEALKVSEVALNIKRKINGKNKLGYVFDLNNIGLSWYKKGNKQQALLYYQSAIQICEQRNVRLIQYGQTCLGMSNIYKLDDKQRYEEYYQRGMKILKKLKPKLYDKLIQQVKKEQ